MDDCVESDIIFKWTYSCRLCLSTCAEIDIFETEELFSDLSNKLSLHLNHLIYKGDPMPRKICNKCLDVVNSWHDFKQKCQENEINLKKKLHPFKTLDFVRGYLEKAETGKRNSVSPFQGAGAFLGVAVKEEPVEDQIAAPNEIPANEPPVVSVLGDSNSFEDNSADTVYDNASDGETNTIGLDLIRQVAAEVSNEVHNSLVDARTAEEVADDKLAGGVNDETLPHSLKVKTDLCYDSASRKKGEKICDNPLLNPTDKIPQSSPTAESGEMSITVIAENIVQQDEDEKMDTEETDLLTEEPETRMYNLRPRCEPLSSYGEVENWREELIKTPTMSTVGPKFITPWKCEVCLVYFSSSKNLDNHHLSANCLGASMDKYNCLICGKLFFSQISLAEHNLVHVRIAFNVNVDELSQCNKCDLAFADTWRLKEHRICHAQKSIPDDATRYPCHDCGLVFIKKINHEKHVLAKHIQRSTEKLTEVKSIDLDTPNQEQNVTAEKKVERDYACSFCIARFKSEDLLYDHRFAIHGIPDERVACGSCGMKFRDAQSLSEHARTHEKKAVAKKTTNPFFKISNFRSLGKEQTSLANGSVRCRRCGVVFHSSEELARHETEKHRNMLPYLCRKCSRRFPTRSLLLLHHREHAGDVSVTAPAPIATEEIKNNIPTASTASQTPYINGMQCSNCFLIFKSDFDLQEHIKAHLHFGDPILKFKHGFGIVYRYQCMKCPKLLSCEKSFPKHSLIKHGTKVGPFYSLRIPISRTAENIQSFQYYCEKCKLNLKSQAALNFHNKIKHCGIFSGDRSVIKNETAKSQPKEFFKGSVNLGRRKCRYCSKICSTFFNLERHEKSHQNKKSKSRRCPICGKICRDRRTFIKHENYCRRKNQKLEEEAEVAVALPTPPHSAPPMDLGGSGVTCTICRNIYETPSLLELHSMTAHGIIPPAKGLPKEPELWQEEINKIIRQVGGVTRCTLCQMEFESSDAAAWHRSQHPRGNLYILQIGDSLFQCTICDQLFHDRKISLKHAVEHGDADVKPIIAETVHALFSCPFCNTKFSTEDSIRNHIFYVHPGGSANHL